MDVWAPLGPKRTLATVAQMLDPLRMDSFRGFPAATCALALAFLCAGCLDVEADASTTPINSAEHSIGGKTAQEIFANDEALRALAIAACEGRADDVMQII